MSLLMLDNNQGFGFTQTDKLGLGLGLGLGMPLLIFIVVAIVFGRRASEEHAWNTAGLGRPLSPGERVEDE
jgi:hypothetical protein